MTWKGRIEAAAKVLDAVIPSVGRIEVANHPDYTWLGTGWIVDDGLVVTNRHVALEFAQRGPRGFVFRRGVGDASITCDIDFLEEYQRASSAEFAIEFDALDRCARRRRHRVPPPRARRPRTSAAPCRASYVSTAQFNGRDHWLSSAGPEDSDQDLVTKIFGEVYDKKRLAPGQLMTVSEDEVTHDCSTLGGNSGSIVVDLDSGLAVGLHFSGLYLHANYAVPSTRLTALLRMLGPGTPAPLPGLDIGSSDPVRAQARLAADIRHGHKRCDDLTSGDTPRAATRFVWLFPWRSQSRSGLHWHLCRRQRSSVIRFG